eukprot:SAG22_NODE_40_length_25739_cov_38.630031_2_plen_587_part_00
MFYRGGLNTSGCCGQRICTECFLQVAKPNDTDSRQCPFCQLSGYQIKYTGTLTQEEWMEREAEEQRVIKMQIAMREDEIKRDKERAEERTRRRAEGLPDLDPTHLSVSGEIETSPGRAPASGRPGAGAQAPVAASAATAAARQRGPPTTAPHQGMRMQMQMQQMQQEMTEDDFARMLSADEGEYGSDQVMIHEAMMIHEAIQRSLSATQQEDAQAAGRDSAAAGAPRDSHGDNGPSDVQWIDGFDDEDGEYSAQALPLAAPPHPPAASSPSPLPAAAAAAAAAATHTMDAEVKTGGGVRGSSTTARGTGHSFIHFSNRWGSFEHEEIQFDWSEGECFVAAWRRLFGPCVPSLCGRELLSVVVYSRRLANRPAMAAAELSACLEQCEQFAKGGLTKTRDIDRFCRPGARDSHSLLDLLLEPNEGPAAPRRSASLEAAKGVDATSGVPRADSEPMPELAEHSVPPAPAPAEAPAVRMFAWADGDQLAPGTDRGAVGRTRGTAPAGGGPVCVEALEEETEGEAGARGALDAPPLAAAPPAEPEADPALPSPGDAGAGFAGIIAAEEEPSEEEQLAMALALSMQDSVGDP